MQNYQYSKVFKPKTLKSKQKKIKPKPKQSNMFYFGDIKLLIHAKNILDSLPSAQHYQLENETEYARKIGQVIPFLQLIKLEQIQFVVSESTLKKIVLQLTRQIEFKEIVLTLLRLVLRGGSSFQKIVEGQLFDVLSFMIEIEELGGAQRDVLPDSSTKHLKGKVASIAALELTRSIAKWYGCSPSGRQIAERYGKLYQAMG